ncbi:MAG: hypothetical protein HYT98_00050 [Candidatus Sungbacteria bacterium]|nr:hypothetical protein [Candidatus Sungbacteria bacterium]
MENLLWAFLALQWWEYVVLFIIIYLLLGLYGMSMYFRNDHTCWGNFWKVSSIWWVLLIVNLSQEVIPYYLKCRKEHVKKRVKAKIKKYGLSELKTD